jgi:hypothetical protein
MSGSSGGRRLAGRDKIGIESSRFSLRADLRRGYFTA